MFTLINIINNLNGASELSMLLATSSHVAGLDRIVLQSCFQMFIRFWVNFWLTLNLGCTSWSACARCPTRFCSFSGSSHNLIPATSPVMAVSYCHTPSHT